VKDSLFWLSKEALQFSMSLLVSKRQGACSVV